MLLSASVDGGIEFHKIGPVYIVNTESFYVSVYRFSVIVVG